MLRLSTNDPDQTTDLGRRLGEALSVPVAFMLGGSYGTGKTTFAQGLALGLGVIGLVRSPSYNILKVYEGRRFSFLHADLYRMKSLTDIHELGLGDMLEGNTVIAVEWPGTVDGFSLNMPTAELAFSFGEGQDDSSSGDVEQSRVIELGFSSDCPPVLAEVASAFIAR